MHIISLSWDDGFLKSSIKTAEIFEKYGLSACFNVIATGHETSFSIGDSQKGIPKGDFELWNKLQNRGHEIMPHGYRHAKKSELPFEEAKELISKCLEVFRNKLDGFDANKSILNFPYNASTPELEGWLLKEVRAFRTAGENWFNPLPSISTNKIVTTGFGPGNSENDLNMKVDKFLKLPEGWLVYNLHGLDGEGWGPIGSQYLDSLLKRLIDMPNIKIQPTGMVLHGL